MVKNLLTVLAVFVIAGIVVLYFSPSDEIPPTPAWSTITVIYNETVTMHNGTMTAIKYNDNMTIMTDGSIRVGFATVP